MDWFVVTSALSLAAMYGLLGIGISLTWSSIGMLNLAMVAIGLGAVGRARSLLRAVLLIADETGSRPAIQSLLEVLTGLAAISGEWNAAARFFGTAETHSTETGLRRDPADEAFLAPLVQLSRQRLGQPGFAAAESAGRALRWEDALSEVRVWLGDDHQHKD